MSRRRAVVRVNLYLLMPFKATIVNVLSSSRDTVDVVVEHPDFPEVPQGEALPERNVIATIEPAYLRCAFSEPQ